MPTEILTVDMKIQSLGMVFIMKKFSKIKLRTIVIAVIIAAFIALFIYSAPQNITCISVAASNDNISDTVNISLTLTTRRSICKPTQTTGKIVFDGVEYVAMSSLGYDHYDSNSLWENIKLKFQGFSYDVFVRSDLTGQQIQLLEDTITIERMADNEILIRKSDDSRDISTLYTISIEE